jgi:hypothetical protein
MNVYLLHLGKYETDKKLNKLTQRISVAIPRGNAASILATMPPTAKNFENIYHSL